MKHSELIERAKKHLWDGKTERVCIGTEPCICLAVLSATCEESNEEITTCHDITKYVSSLLGGWGTIGAWLKNEKGIEWTKQGGYRELQAYRLRFMDELIKRYQAEGK